MATLCVSVQVSQGMVGQGAARRAAGIILEMVKVFVWLCVYLHWFVILISVIVLGG